MRDEAALAGITTYEQIDSTVRAAIESGQAVPVDDGPAYYGPKNFLDGFMKENEKASLYPGWVLEEPYEGQDKIAEEDEVS